MGSYILNKKSYTFQIEYGKKKKIDDSNIICTYDTI